MILDPSRAALEQFPTLKSWCDRYPDASRHLHFEPLPPGRRIDSRTEVLRQIAGIVADTNQSIADIERCLLECSACPPVSFSAPFDDDPRMLLFLREQMFITKKIQKRRLRLLTLRFDFFVDRLRRCRLIETLLNGAKIPPTLGCRIDDALSAGDMPATFSHQSCILSYLTEKARRMAQTASYFPRPLAQLELSEILREILKTSRVDPDVGYTYPTPMENVLARFLFGPYSKFRQPIDVLVKKVGALPPEDFTQHVVKLCIDIMPEESYTSTEQSTVLLILLRTVFNRCYEVNSSYFMHTTDHALLSKLFILGRGAAKRLPLPWRILGGQETNESLPEFFGHFSFYLSAAQFFYGAIFEPNPMDALWHVHKCLVAIQKAALIHGSGGEVVSQSELHRLLSFDDMFALLFGVALTSEIPDLFYIAKLIGNFAPKGLLSASFEYAWATLDALATHCAQVTIDDAPE